ncbi:MAG: NAD(P)-dependent oxidoreductase [Patescibacteria group bacterium]
MRILLLGGTGFIGEYLAKNLSKRKDCQLDIIYNYSLPPENKPDNISYYKIDLTLFASRTRATNAGHANYALSSMAQETATCPSAPGRFSNSHFTKQSDNLKELVNKAEILIILTQPNLGIINNLISVIRPGSCLKKIVYLSTTLLYNDSSEKKDESARLEPTTEYEKNKYIEEQKLAEFVNKFNLNLCIARLSNVYGDIKNKGLVGKIFTVVLKDESIKINGSGTQVRDYIFIEDAVNLLEFLIYYKQVNKQEIFNICTSQGHSVSELIKTIKKVIAKKINIINSPAILEKQTVVGDNNKIISLSGYKFKFNLLKGLEKTYINYKKL